MSANGGATAKCCVSSVAINPWFYLQKLGFLH